MRKLWLDDVRPPEGIGWEQVYSAESAIEYCKYFGCPDFISFDHDLGPVGKYKSGYDFAHWLVEQDLDMRGMFIPKDFKFRVHSMNPVGRENIERLLKNYLQQRDGSWSNELRGPVL